MYEHARMVFCIHLLLHGVVYQSGHFVQKKQQLFNVHRPAAVFISSSVHLRNCHSHHRHNDCHTFFGNISLKHSRTHVLFRDTRFLTQGSNFNGCLNGCLYIGQPRKAELVLQSAKWCRPVGGCCFESPANFSRAEDHGRRLRQLRRLCWNVELSKKSSPLCNISWRHITATTTGQKWPSQLWNCTAHH